jgi:hypothetical protein
MVMRRESQVFMLTLSYRINNYKVNERDRGDRGSGGGDDLDMGM